MRGLGKGKAYQKKLEMQGLADQQQQTEKEKRYKQEVRKKRL